MKKSLVLQVKAIGFRTSWCLLALSFLVSPAAGREFPETIGRVGRVFWMATVGDGRQLASALDSVIRIYLPGVPEGDNWKVIIEDRTTFLAEGDAVAHEYTAGNHMFPPRCHTVSKLRVTECMGPWVREFSQAAKAGTMAHEYGHILCSDQMGDAKSSETCADNEAAKVLCPQCFVWNGKGPPLG